ncbi:YceI family protein [Mucilaginibacter sp. BJC16-A38]|uniref:YceI family protein n=1 Tax=Mucilaginibacter phenanthrenivorans TaxID=1234842 RepID=UPI002157B7CC|nr:YceI family protein [Mucilaginibacter phenanthrenivorans]MCR8557845.1 YceI family protein [Mucilaginibacter phenanthrenivorans]
MKKTLSILLLIGLSACTKDIQQPLTFVVNSSTSKIGWKGSASDHSHIGSFDLNGTVITNPDGTVKSGDFTIPVASIMDYDLTDPAKQQLLDDLKSANFFKIATYPDTKFHITGVAPYRGTDTSAVQGANYLMTGDFTMTGETHELSFPVKIGRTADSLKTEAKFKLDRTKWGMNIYNDPSKPLYIYPDVNISLHILAARSK